MPRARCPHTQKASCECPDSAGMDVELTPNPDKCARFEPNPFKTQKCKHCGRPWTEHLGVISEEHVAKYTEALQKAADDKAAKEAEAKAKAKAKATAKKKAQQAVEDEWLFDGSATGESHTIDLDSDDDLGFRMYSASDMASAPVESRQPRNSETTKTLKVVNLIDFGECDVPEEDATVSSSSTSFAVTRVPPEPAGVSPVSAAATLPPSSSESLSAVVKSPPPAGRSGRSVSPGAHLRNGFGSGMGSHEEALLAEIDHLRQQLDDAAQERQIQVEMIKDDVLEKQKQVEELAQKNSDIEVALKSSKEEALAVKQSLTAAQDEAVTRETEVQTLRLQAAELKDQLAAAEARAASQPHAATDTHAAQQASEAARAAQAELERQAQERQAEQAELQRLRDEVQAATTASAVEQEAHAQALQRLFQERDALTSEVQSLRQLQEASKADMGVVAAKEQPVSEEVVALVSEACHICNRTLRLLADDSQGREAAVANDLTVPADLERSLRMLRDTASAMQTAAERADADRRRLSQELADSKASSVAAGGTPLEANANESPEGAALAPYKDNTAHPVSAEAKAAANAVSREAAKALREVRMNAERQLAWIRQRMENGVKDENVAPPQMNTTCGI